jgi:hypothetical protein
MRHILVAASFLLMGSIAGFAQSTDEHRGQGYAFFAPGVSTSNRNSGFMHTGGGGEVLIKRVGIGGELGYLAPWRYLSDGIGVGSLNGSFNLKPGKISPFVTGGYTLFFRDGSANGYNFGAGVHYWFSDRAGLRFEVRDNVLPDYRDQNFVGFRIGVSFR